MITLFQMLLVFVGKLEKKIMLFLELFVTKAATNFYNLYCLLVLQNKNKDDDPFNHAYPFACIGEAF